MQYSVTNRETFSYIGYIQHTYRIQQVTCRGYTIHSGDSRLFTEDITYIQYTVGYLQGIQHTFKISRLLTKDSTCIQDTVDYLHRIQHTSRIQQVTYRGYNIHKGYSRLLTEDTTYIQDTIAVIYIGYTGRNRIQQLSYIQYNLDT